MASLLLYDSGVAENNGKRLRSQLIEVSLPLSFAHCVTPPKSTELAQLGVFFSTEAIRNVLYAVLSSRFSCVLAYLCLLMCL